MECIIRAHRSFVTAEVDPRLFSSFIEQLGRSVYGGVYENGHVSADADGLRTDVIDLVKALSIPMVRFPGGNYVSNYNWEDSVGPQAQRPCRLDLAWSATDPNRFGLKEFMQWSHKTGVQPMLALNLGTRGIAEARNLVEYCNHPSGSYWSDLRIAHGSPEPFAIKTWCLGNEMDGPWQVGHKTADEYGRLACETAKALKLFDPTLQLVVCGSSYPGIPTFPAWEATVLDHCYEVVDYISLHSYYQNKNDDLPTFLGSSLAMEAFIQAVVATCDYVKARKRSDKTMYLSFDEWNVWFHSNAKDTVQPKWTVGPALLEDVYTFEDALVVGTLLNCLLRHADRVRIACLAQLVNAIAPIMTRTGGPAWRQTIYWPFYYVSHYGRGTVLDLRLEVPSYANPTYGPIPYVDATAVFHGESGEIDVFLVNRSETEQVKLSLELSGFASAYRLVEHIALSHADRKAMNDEAHPDHVFPRRIAVPGGIVFENQGDLDAGPLTWNMFRLQAVVQNGDDRAGL